MWYDISVKEDHAASMLRVKMKAARFSEMQAS
jgi:hypothetical protein